MAEQKKKNQKGRCINCGRAMKQQFIGLKHCKCGISWKKDIGYFERNPNMVFALERRKIGKKIKQVPVIRTLTIFMICLLLSACSSVSTDIIGSSDDPTSVFMAENNEPEIHIEKIASVHNENGNIIPDDIIEGARIDVANKSNYKNAYYSGGYLPEDEGVCTNLVWRAFKNAGYDLKSMIDNDIKANVSKYPRITGAPDTDIGFRRVPNHIVFFSRHGTVLTKEVDAYDTENLKQWQGGDIVTIVRPEHIGIISDKRNKKGVPYVIHNMGPVPREEDCLESWNDRITGHFRYPVH